MITMQRCVILMSIMAAACIRPINGAFGIPEFLEMGQCNNATLKDGFDPVKYQGMWFTIQSVPNEYENSKQCNTMNYTWHDDRLLSIGRGLSEEGKKIKQISEIMEEFELREPPHPAYMTVIAAGVPESPYEIVSTDYVTYSCVHSCLEYFGFKAEFFWVLGRTPHISRDLVTQCHESLESFGVDPSKFVDVPQGEPCPYMKKLDDIFDKNRQLLIKLGVLNENAPPFTYEPPSPIDQETANEIEEGQWMEEDKKREQEVLPKPEIPVRTPDSEEGTVLEDPLEEVQHDTDLDNSSAPCRTSNIAIPVFVLVAVLLPALPR